MPLFGQHAARNETGLNIVPDREPREEVRVLEDETAFRAWACDRFGADQELAGVGKIETGKEAKESRLAAATRADERNQFSGCKGKRNTIEGRAARERIVGRGKAFAEPADAKRRGFGRANGYHLITPFCQTSTRSRTLNKGVMIVEKKAAIMMSAA